MSNVHVLSLVETWSGGGNPEHATTGFTFVANSTRKKHKKARRFSGGISIYIKNDLVKGVAKMSLKAASHLTENSATKGNEWEN